MTIKLTLPITPLSISPVTLNGRLTRLEPLAVHHARGLHKAATPETFRYLYIQPESWTLEGFESYTRTLLGDATRTPFAIIHQSSACVIGSTSFLSTRPSDQATEIGTTWFQQGFWGSLVNPEIKFLMLRHAFETLKVQRVALRADGRNTRSIAAIRKLGAFFEGTNRRSSIDRFGVCRDMATFAIIPEEWPSVRAGLVKRLGYEP